MLVDLLADRVMEFAKKEHLVFEDFAVGLKYSYVIVKGPKGREMGVAYMPVEDLSRGFADEPRANNLREMVSSTNMQSKSLGIAAINAISQYILWKVDMPKNVRYRNIVEHIPECCPEGRVVVVGNMVPLVKNLKEKMDVVVLERNPKLRFNAYPDSLAARVIPEADVVIITGATLVNDSIDTILSLTGGRKFLVGPTAGVHPSWLNGKIDLIAGTRIKDIEKTRKIIKMGGGRWDFAPFCEEYIFTPSDF